MRLGSGLTNQYCTINVEIPHIVSPPSTPCLPRTSRPYILLVRCLGLHLHIHVVTIVCLVVVLGSDKPHHNLFFFPQFTFLLAFLPLVSPNMPKLFKHYFLQRGCGSSRCLSSFILLVVPGSSLFPSCLHPLSSDHCWLSTWSKLMFPNSFYMTTYLYRCLWWRSLFK